MEKKTLYGLDKKGGVKVWSVWTEEEAVYVEHGKLSGRLTTKVTKCKGKNKGRSNATTDAEQASSEAHSKWNKQYDKYYRESIEDAKAITTEGVMLAQDYTKKPHFLEEVFYASRKLDGLRCKSVYKDGVLAWVSRGGKQYPVPKHLKAPLEQLHKESGLMYLDGEAYCHGHKLQKIQSAVKKPNELTKDLTYEIFDIPLEGVLWEKRLEKLNSLEIYTNQYSHINIVENIKATKDNLQELIERFIAEGFEGVMLRNASKGLYEFQNKRSNDLLKYKLMFDDECKVISCTEDKNGQGLFTVEYKSPATNKIVNFDLSMNGSHEENSYSNLSKRIGEWVTFKYQDFSEDGIPSFARGLYFRECDSKGTPLE